jgi:4-diphosphocytidyl-2-C-methyl-D-erythritol kinase
MSQSVLLRASAKVNLTLRVGPRRDDGYHDVQTLLQSLALADTVKVTGRSGPFGLLCRAPGVPGDRSNLIWRAAEALWHALGRSGEPRDAHVRLDKQIPVAAGLGGGSADAAAALVGLNLIWNGRLSRRELVSIAATLGADVPFSLVGGTAMGLGRGEEVYPLEDVTRLGVIVIKPSFGVSTAEAYGWLDADREAGVETPVDRRRQEVEVGWPAGPVPLINDLQAPVARRHPAVDELVSALVSQGAMAAAMSGSGSAVFGLFSESAAPRAVARLQRPDRLVLLTRTIGRREALRRIGL